LFHIQDDRLFREARFPVDPQTPAIRKFDNQYTKVRLSLKVPPKRVACIALGCGNRDLQCLEAFRLQESFGSEDDRCPAMAAGIP